MVLSKIRVFKEFSAPFYTLYATFYTLKAGPIVYRLGHKILILVSAVRLRVGSPLQKRL